MKLRRFAEEPRPSAAMFQFPNWLSGLLGVLDCTPFRRARALGYARWHRGRPNFEENRSHAQQVARRMDPLIIALICFVLAIALAVADLFVPSGGVLAIASFLTAVVSVYFAYRSSPAAGTMMLVVMLIAIPIFLTVALRVWPYTPLGRRIILRTPEVEPFQETSAADPLLDLVGQIGVAQNSLLPSGHVRINHRNYNALCEGGVIEAGQNVEVVGVHERNLVVVASTLPVQSQAATSRSETKAKKLGESLLDQPAEDLGLDSLDG